MLLKNQWAMHTGYTLIKIRYNQDIFDNKERADCSFLFVLIAFCLSKREAFGQ